MDKFNQENPLPKPESINLIKTIKGPIGDYNLLIKSLLAICKGSNIAHDSFLQYTESYEEREERLIWTDFRSMAEKFDDPGSNLSKSANALIVNLKKQLVDELSVHRSEKYNNFIYLLDEILDNKEILRIIPT